MNTPDRDSYRIRSATRADVEAIKDILNYYIEHSTVIFVMKPQTLEERLAWFDAHTEEHPVTVAEVGGTVVGWGALSPFRPQPAYARTAELSIYLRQDFTGQGLARAIVSDLIARARTAGHHVLVGVCCSDAVASIRLLESFGFSRAGHLREVGRKFDRWLDVVFLQLVL
jgi:phosphinothricin acetyltransferase